MLLGVLICLCEVIGRFRAVVNSVGNVASFCFVVVLDCVFEVCVYGLLWLVTSAAWLGFGLVSLLWGDYGWCIFVVGGWVRTLGWLLVLVCGFGMLIVLCYFYSFVILDMLQLTCCV